MERAACGEDRPRAATAEGVVTAPTGRKFASARLGNFRILPRSGEFGLYTPREHCRICQH
jgi:hypothetical protein